MEIRKISSSINKLINGTQSSNTNSYLARKINAPDSVSFSASKNQGQNLFKKICLAVTAVAIAFSLNKPNTNNDSKQNIESNTNPITVVQNTENKIIKYPEPTNAEDLKPEPDFSVGIISKPDKEVPKSEDIKDKPPVVVPTPDEEIVVKYAPPVDIGDEEPTPPVINPTTPEEEIVVKYAPPVDIGDEESTPPEIIPDFIEGIVLKYAPPMDIG